MCLAACPSIRQGGGARDSGGIQLAILGALELFTLSPRTEGVPVDMAVGGGRAAGREASAISNRSVMTWRRRETKGWCKGGREEEREGIE